MLLRVLPRHCTDCCRMSQPPGILPAPESWTGISRVLYFCIPQWKDSKMHWFTDSWMKNELNSQSRQKKEAIKNQANWENVKTYPESGGQLRS
jgi:hypothetical protein